MRAKRVLTASREWPYLASWLQWSQDNVVLVPTSGGGQRALRGLPELSVARPAVEHQPVVSIIHNVAALPVLRGARAQQQVVLLPLVGRRLQVVGSFVRGAADDAF